MDKTLFSALAFVLLLSGMAFAGSLNTTDIGPGMDWKTHACIKPAPPPVPSITDAKSYGTAIKVYNAYVKMVNEYIKCVNNEAQQDAKSVIESINQGSKDTVRSITKDARKLLQNIEAKHPDNKTL